MKGIFRYTQRLQGKTFLFSILLLSLFTSATNYSSYSERIINPELTLVEKESKDRQAVNYNEALEIAFTSLKPVFPRFQERVYSLKDRVSFQTYVKYYVSSERSKQYKHIVNNYRDDLPPTPLT